MLDSFEHLIRVLNRLPSIGRRSAERMALRLATDRGTLRKDVLAALRAVDETLTLCSRCGSLTEREADPCALCTSPRRRDGVLCVVEDPGDVLIMERAGGYDGRYHCLGGKLSPMRGQGAADITVETLLQRVREESISEVILALNTDVESDATAHYLRDVLRSRDVTVSHLAWGLPAGSGIAYADPQTLSRAMAGRQAMDE